jgi:hypothetical protein
MAKKNRPLKHLGREHVRASLLSSFPFLRNKYRELKPDELNSEDVFMELFGEKTKIELFKLKAIYEYQK